MVARKGRFKPNVKGEMVRKEGGWLVLVFLVFFSSSQWSSNQNIARLFTWERPVSINLISLFVEVVYHE